MGCRSCAFSRSDTAGPRPPREVAPGRFQVALAGNPNTGKSTVFNSLTGLKQHVGNWPGKTVQRAEGSFLADGHRFELVDLPGTYSLLATSTDEQVARDFLLFGRPDLTVVVLDATCLERNLNLLFQVLEITDRVVVCLNLVDEAERKGLRLDPARLAAELGVPVVPTVANHGRGLAELVRTISAVCRGELEVAPHRLTDAGAALAAAERLVPLVDHLAPALPNARWVALRLIEDDPTVTDAVREGRLVDPDDAPRPPEPAVVGNLLAAAETERERLGPRHTDELVAGIYARAERISAACVTDTGVARLSVDETLDRVLTSRVLGFAVMLGILAVIFWLTIAGANVPSRMIAEALFVFEGTLARWLELLGAPWWLIGALVHGVYRGTAWVISVMLPPMAIFFPCFTLLEDLGYLPRVAFNLDRFFRAVGAHGKQALTMCMGFGCNAAGVTACRVIDSPRERLVAILTNNFVPCNGRWPTLIMLALVFVSPLFGRWGSVAAAATLVSCTLFGVLATLLVSLLLSKTVLKGESSAFTLELPGYRRPRFWQIMYTSLIDRTLFVLWRAVIFAAPAGLIIWVLGNWMIGGQAAFAHAAGWLDPLGRAIGLDGVILLAYVVAIPANEIIVPTIFMGYNVLSAEHLGQRVMVEMDSLADITRLLVQDQGWTMLTAICLILFCILHNPCSTTAVTIWKETRSARWTAVGFLMPLAIAFAVCFTVAQLGRALGLAG